MHMNYPGVCIHIHTHELTYIVCTRKIYDSCYVNFFIPVIIVQLLSHIIISIAVAVLFGGNA